MPPKKTEYTKAVGGRLERLQQVLELKHGQFAKILGVSPQSLSNYYAGITLPKPWSLLPLKERYGITFDYVLAGDLAGVDGRVYEKLRRPVEVKPGKAKRKVA